MKKCLLCRARTKCLDSRSNADGNTRRRYECTECGHRHSTLEILVEARNHFTAHDLLNTGREDLKSKIIELLADL